METRSTLRYLTGLWILVSLVFIGCAQFQHKLPETLPFMDRSQTKTDGEVRVTVAVPSAEESEQIFGFPLAGKNIQPVWLEVENNSDTRVFSLPHCHGSGYLFVRRGRLEVPIQPLFQRILKKISTIYSVITKSIGISNPAARPRDSSIPT